MKRSLLSIFSGLLLGFSWPNIGFFPFIFIAFIPLLLLEENISKSGEKSFWKIFKYSFLAFLIFNIITTYWIWNATAPGAIVAFVINSLLMTFPFLIFHKVKKVFGSKIGYIAFVMFWITMEYLHLNWELAWPWLILGNVFAENVGIVQWYEFTGVLGGTIWVLAINVLLFIWSDKRYRWNYKKLILPFTILLIPIIISLSLKIDFDEEKTIEVVIVQPNVDPYHDKFNRNSQEQLDDFISLAREKLTFKSSLLIGPETVLQELLWENKMEHSTSIQKLQELQTEFHELNILIGSSTCSLVDKEVISARQINNTDIWYNIYNSAILLDKDSMILVYHKRKLVPGVEQIPYSHVLNLLGDLTIDLGGTSGSLGRDNTIFSFKINEDIEILPLICYESVFGDIMKGRNSNMIVIITNDGWWKNTAGYKQHFNYARLRAIEQRKTVIRSANTGISGLISPNGEIMQSIDWDQEEALKVDVPINHHNTFYNRFGDYIGRIFSFISVLILLSAFVKSKIK